ncbi:hypothetical protein GK108_10435 [Spirosoma terrae]|uniref:Uncharacterized protein n=1 Tax=Spirosoma terrae TaxID=1968276 RepID=A0A6L9LF25_9BACT|nr:hypothetical protein [Spirosoma terrae]
MDTKRSILRNFNSTTVRLEGADTSEGRQNRSNFNSTTVRLEVFAPIALAQIFPNFNSTTVRLEAPCRTRIVKPVSISIPLRYD